MSNDQHTDERDIDKLFEQEPYDISRQYAGYCASFAVLAGVLTVTGRPEMAAHFSIVIFVAMAIGFYGLIGPTVVGWRDVDGL